MTKRSEAVSLIKGLAKGSPEERKYHAEFVRARAEGHAEGKAEGVAEVVTFLQRKYLNQSLTRHSSEGEAILRLVREIAGEFGGK